MEASNRGLWSLEPNYFKVKKWPFLVQKWGKHRENNWNWVFLAKNAQIWCFFMFRHKPFSTQQHCPGVSIFQVSSLRIWRNSRQAKKGDKKNYERTKKQPLHPSYFYTLSDSFLSASPDTAEKILFLFASSVYLCLSLATLLKSCLCEKGNGLINRLKKIRDFSEYLQQCFLISLI